MKDDRTDDRPVLNSFSKSREFLLAFHKALFGRDNGKTKTLNIRPGDTNLVCVRPSRLLLRRVFIDWNCFVLQPASTHGKCGSLLILTYPWCVSQHLPRRLCSPSSSSAVKNAVIGKLNLVYLTVMLGSIATFEVSWQKENMTLARQNTKAFVRKQSFQWKAIRRRLEKKSYALSFRRVSATKTVLVIILLAVKRHLVYVSAGKLPWWVVMRASVVIKSSTHGM